MPCPLVAVTIPDERLVLHADPSTSWASSQAKAWKQCKLYQYYVGKTVGELGAYVESQSDDSPV